MTVLCVIRTYTIDEMKIVNDRFTIMPTDILINCYEPTSAVYLQCDNDIIEMDYYDSNKQISALREYVQVLQDFGSKCLC